MDDEILDLVNENDEVVGEVPRSLANTNPKYLHREIAILLVDNKNRIMLQKRSLKKLVNPGYWTLTAGHVGKKMDPLEAAHKELKEELGFDTDLKLVRKVKVSYLNEVHFTYIYIGKYNNEKIIMESKELTETKMFSKDELAEMQTKEIKVGTHSLQWCYDFWEGKLKYEN